MVAMTEVERGVEQVLAHLTDEELLRDTRRIAGRSNQLFAGLLLHLAEVEARGLHRLQRCASLYTYCIYELRFSEDAAARRSAAARLAREFPLILDYVAKGALHLTGLLIIGPHLTATNHVDVLARAKFRTKKEIAKLLRELSPLPRVADSVEPLGPAPTRRRALSWAEMVAAHEGPFRELPVGERPQDWTTDDDVAVEDSGSATKGSSESSRNDDGSTAVESEAMSELTQEPSPITAPQQYHVQFTTTEEHIELIRKAKDLLASKGHNDSTLAALHVRAMKLLVAELEKRRYGAPIRSRATVTHTRQTPTDREGPERLGATSGAATVAISEEPARRGEPKPGEAPPRYVPAPIRREVFTRDGGRCTYVDVHGRRCCETRHVELHHLVAFANGGEHTAANLTLRCHAHNRLAAELDFGREHIALQSGRLRHERGCQQQLVAIVPPTTAPARGFDTAARLEQTLRPASWFPTG